MEPDLADALALRLGTELQLERERRSLRLDDLADDTGVSPASLSLYLRGKRAMPLSVFLRTCAALDVVPGDLIARAHTAVNTSG